MTATRAILVADVLGPVVGLVLAVILTRRNDARLAATR